MRRFLSPKLQISLGLMSLTISLIFVAISLGLLPSEEKAELRARATLSVALAAQLASLASRNDVSAIKDTIDALVGGEADILSVGIRDNEGKLLTASPGHGMHWRDQPDGKSTPTHFQVPLLNGDTPAGRIEIVFRPMSAGAGFFGLPNNLVAFITFIGAAGFVGSYVILSGALRELDLGDAVPDRVEAAFDTLAEGVLIMDEQERIVMANRAFAEQILGTVEPELGSAASELPWLSSTASPLAPEQLPWRMALHSERPVLGTAMGIRNGAGELQRLIVNATRIRDGDGGTRGVIATFDDVTALHRTNEQLSRSIHQLHLSQLQISEQNQMLRLLASSDPLTGCLNRRTFFEQAERLFSETVKARQPMSFVMVDADHFKSINDRFGHVVGDKVLVGLSNLLKGYCCSPNLLGRYGGEEFCFALVQLSDSEVERLVERIRLAISAVSTWLPNGERTTVSIGIASLGEAPCTLAELVKRADDALYAAKSAGRNCCVSWRDISRSPPTQQHDRSLAFAGDPP